MWTKTQSAPDEAEDFKESIDYLRSTMGPNNADRYKARVDRLYKAAVQHGIRLAASVAADYDKYSIHPFLVSECVLGKLNALKRKPRKNKNAEKMNAIISAIEKKVASIEGMTRFMYGVAKWEKREKRARKQ